MIFSKCCGCFNQQEILQNVGDCDLHKVPYMYICLNKQPQCTVNPLMCYQCLQNHKGHQFQTIDKYFTPQFRYIIRSGTSLNGHAMHRLIEHMTQDLKKMRAKLITHMDKLQVAIMNQLQKLKPKYPLHDKFGIPGTYLNKQNIPMILDIFQRQKTHIWAPATQKYIRTVVGQATSMLGNMLNDVENFVTGQPYQSFDQKQGLKRADDFIKKYQGVFSPQRHYFTWSGIEKHQNIRVHQQGLIAKFINNSPAKPSVLASNPFSRSVNKVYIKITKLQQTALVFDATLISIGACVPNVAKIFGYKQLIQPSHGAFMIGSNGKCYHSSLQKYNKKALSFAFGQGDVIAIWIDFDKKRIFFSKWGFFQRNFDMELTVKDTDLMGLRPCVMFHGEVGAMVHIVNQNVYKQKQSEQVYDL